MKVIVSTLSYKGKPWMYVEGYNFYYLKPDEIAAGFEAENMNYSRKDLGSGEFEYKIAAVDIDRNGFVEIFMSSKSNLKIFHFKEAASSKLSSNCMVFILACLTGSFQIADMIYA